MRQPTVRRFYKSAEVREAEGGGFALMLDGRAARTPGSNKLAAASRALMERGRRGMGAAGRDARSGRHAADEAPQLRYRRRRAHDGGDAGRHRALRRLRPPLLPGGGAGGAGGAAAARLRSGPDWAAEALGARFNLAAGVIHVAQPPEALAAVGAGARGGRRSRGARRAQRHHEPHRLGAAGARRARGFLTPAEAWRAAHIDEDFQNEQWGVDEEARARRAARWREMEAAAMVLAATCDL